MRAPAQPIGVDLAQRWFDPDRATAWEADWGHALRGGRFPYDRNSVVWVVRQPQAVEWAWEGTLWRLTVPVGWVTDLASIPGLLVPLAGKVDSLGTPAVVAHDALYQTKGFPPQAQGESWLQRWAQGAWVDPRRPRCVSRREADYVLRDVALRSNVPPWRAWKAWLGVRLNFFASIGWC